MPKTLEMLAQKGQFHLSSELQAKLASRGFTDIISRSANGERELLNCKTVNSFWSLIYSLEFFSMLLETVSSTSEIMQIYNLDRLVLGIILLLVPALLHSFGKLYWLDLWANCLWLFWPTNVSCERKSKFLPSLKTCPASNSTGTTLVSFIPDWFWQCFITCNYLTMGK